MPKKLLRRLAGCFAIELLFAAGLLAADSDYQAGTAAEPVRPSSVQAIALGRHFVVLAVEGDRTDARVSAAVRQVLARVSRK
jgi:hypothetical protein